MHLRLVGILWLALAIASTLALHAKPWQLQKRALGVKWAKDRIRDLDYLKEDFVWYMGMTCLSGPADSALTAFLFHSSCLGFDRPCPTQKNRYPCLETGMLAGVTCDVDSEADYVDMGYSDFVSDRRRFLFSLFFD